jgi:hypothetical protein
MSKRTPTPFKTLAALSVAVSSLAPLAAHTEETSGSDDWKVSGGLYAWATSITATLKNGNDATLDPKDVIDHLDGVFLGNLELRHGKVFLATDVLYLDLSGSNAALLKPAVGDIAVGGSVDMKSKVNTTIVGYNFIDSSTGTLDAFMGARYIGVDVTAKAQTVGPLGGHYLKSTPSGSNVDGIVGVKGNLNLEGNWSIPYYFDYGSGDSDSTWQTFGGVEYKLDQAKIYGGYRYLEWKLSGPIDSLDISGPVIGFNYNF